MEQPPKYLPERYARLNADFSFLHLTPFLTPSIFPFAWQPCTPDGRHSGQRFLSQSRCFFVFGKEEKKQNILDTAHTPMAATSVKSPTRKELPSSPRRQQ